MKYGLRGLFPVGFFLLLAATGTATPPDSLLRLTPLGRYAAMASAYDRLWHRDTAVAQRLGREWAAFFAQHGTEADRRLLDLALFETDRANQFHNERLVARAHALLRRAGASGDTLVLGRVQVCLGLYYFHVARKYDLSFRHYERAFELIKPQTDATFPRRDYTVYVIADAWFQFFDDENALRCGRELRRVGQADVRDAHVYNACLLGLAYLRLRRPAEARDWFAWGLAQLPLRVPFQNEVWVGIFKGNLGLVALAQHRPEAAQPLLDEGFRLTLRYGDWDNVATFGSRLAELHLRRGEVARAGYFARLAHAAALRTTYGTKFTHQTYASMADWLGAAGRPAEALRYADSARRAKDRWLGEMDVRLKHRAELALATERHRASEQRLARERDRQLLLRNGLLGFLLLGLGVAWLAYRHRVAAFRHQRERAEADLQRATDELERFRESVQEKSALLQQLAAGQATGADDVLLRLRESVLVTDEGWRTFSERFSRAYPGFFQRLREAHPQLSPGEVRLLTLSRLGYSAREMADMLGVGPDAVWKSRQRLRRKLALPDEVSLEDLARGI